jgi:hypothetical protein
MLLARRCILFLPVLLTGYGLHAQDVVSPRTYTYEFFIWNCKKMASKEDAIKAVHHCAKPDEAVQILKKYFSVGDTYKFRCSDCDDTTIRRSKSSRFEEPIQQSETEDLRSTENIDYPVIWLYGDSIIDIAQVCSPLEVKFDTLQEDFIEISWELMNGARNATGYDSSTMILDFIPVVRYNYFGDSLDIDECLVNNDSIWALGRQFRCKFLANDILSNDIVFDFSELEPGSSRINYFQIFSKDSIVLYQSESGQTRWYGNYGEQSPIIENVGTKAPNNLQAFVGLITEQRKRDYQAIRMECADCTLPPLSLLFKLRIGMHCCYDGIGAIEFPIVINFNEE